LIFFHPGEHLKAVRADCDNAYEGVILDRTLALVGSRVFDIYRVRSKDEHQYDWAFHVDGELSSSSLELERQPDALSSKRGYAHITDVQRGRMDQKNCNITYTISEGHSLQLMVLPVSRGEIILGNGLKTKDTRKPVAIVRTRAADADFVTVMTLDSAASVFNVKRLDDMPEGVIGLEIDNLDGGKDYLMSAEKSQRISIAGTEIEGQLALISLGEDGTTTDVEIVK
jgi:hypothetical protein